MDMVPSPNKPRVFRTRQARQDILESAFYIADDSIDASDRFLQASEAAFSKLVDMPGMGRLRDVQNERLAGIRQWTVPGFEKHLIFYRVV